MSDKIISIKSKVFNDAVHGHIELDNLLVAIIDTPQFQRLRKIKQTGGCYYVYPSCSHNRFEHSIGTCHLAIKLLKSLKDKIVEENHGADNPPCKVDIEITDVDIFCVSLAALCHDLGHGIYSHMFENRFLIPLGVKKSHEELSCEFLDNILYSNNKNILSIIQKRYKNKFQEKQIKDGNVPYIEEIAFIKQLIDSKRRKNGLVYPKKEFLYSIICNEESGVDVDKFDYISRDCLHLGIKSTFDHERFIKFAMVLKVNGKYKIALRDKEIQNMYNLFHMRYIVHRTAVKHKTCFAVEIMIGEALQLANDYILLENESKKKRYKLSDSVNDINAYGKVTDGILDKIRYSNKEKLIPAKELLIRIENRNVYYFIGEIMPKELNKMLDISNDTFTKIDESLKKEILKNLSKFYSVNENKLLVDVVEFNYSIGERNPVDKIEFFSKNYRILTAEEKVAFAPMETKVFQYDIARIYFKEISDKYKVTKMKEEFINFKTATNFDVSEIQY